MDANKSVTATFSAVDYTVALLVSPTGTGTTSGGGTTYHVGDSVQIKALANSGYTFVNWTADGAVVSTDATHNFTMPAANVNYTANFIMTYSCYGVSSSSDYDAVNNKTTFTYTVKELGVGGCKDISNVILNFGDASWNDDDNVSISMVVNQPSCDEVIGSDDIKMDNLSSGFTEGTITITLTGRWDAETEESGMTIKAGTGECDFNVYKPKKDDTIYTITATNTNTNLGAISPEGVVSVEHGSSQTFTIAPNSNKEIDKVIVDGVVKLEVDNSVVVSGLGKGVACSYTFIGVIDNHTIVVSFE